MSIFKFTDAENKAVFTCSHILDNKHNILYVSHDGDGDWQFLCGGNHTDEDVKVVTLKQAVELDQTVNDLYEMPVGVCAERHEIGGEWKPFRL
jgi:hypothetical protein